MPNYDYRCQDCHTEFTVERSMNDQTPVTCRLCSSNKAERIWRTFAMSSGKSSSVAPAATSTQSKGGCGSCSSHSCGSCH